MKHFITKFQISISSQFQMMRVPVYLVCAAMAIAVRSEEPSNFYVNQLEPIDLLAEQEALRYYLPKLTTKYKFHREYNDPGYYPFTNNESNDIDQVFVYLFKYCKWMKLMCILRQISLFYYRLLKYLNNKTYLLLETYYRTLIEFDKH